ncbi:unnamed protein product [Prorocentrum cordatum]|uniref:Methyltransferase domain-containing protein n=1 Tax=Prorocentrum cordatum TaxID=2364126 RepID=A0ABN9UU28_9DINO|nr:unnamed protein product [Polarella glacialis]
MGERSVRVNSRTFGKLIKSAARSGRARAAFELLRRLLDAPGLGGADAVAYSTVIDACAKAGLPEQAEECLGQMAAALLRPDAAAYGAVIDGHARQGDAPQAALWLERMAAARIAPDCAAYTAVIDGWARRGAAQEAAEWLQRMAAARVAPTAASYTAAATGLGRAWLHVWCHGVLELPHSLLDATLLHPVSELTETSAARSLIPDRDPGAVGPLAAGGDGEVHEGARQRRGRTALHEALTANDSAAAARLIEAGGLAMLNQPSAAGCTPLMLLAMGHCDEALLWRLLERSGAASVAERSETRRTAADYAAERESSRGPEVVAALRALEAAEVQRTAAVRCPACGDVVRRRPLLAFFWERASRGTEDNPLLQRFFSQDRHRLLLEARCHQINDTRRVRKEVSESMAVLEALERTAPAVGGGWHIVDLCCGRSITAVLAALRYPGVVVSAVDKLDPRFLPHCTVGVESGADGCASYAQMDVLAPTFVADLGRLVEQTARPAASTPHGMAARPFPLRPLLGMHLCGKLSLQAAAAFGSIDALRVAVLSPCCLPSKADPAAPPSLFGSRDGGEQYRRWAAHLEGAVRGAAPAAAVTSEVVADILSPRNVVICASKLFAQQLWPRVPRHSVVAVG